MLPELVIAFGLLALCVVIHASGLAMLLQRHRALVPGHRLTGLQLAGLLVEVASWLLLLHLVEITVWALCYRALDCLPDLETAVYFSGVSYATLGYGDVILPKEWRMLGPVEGLAGILLCGLSTGFFFVALSRLYQKIHPARARGPGNNFEP
jgi:hypothetical protein